MIEENRKTYSHLTLADRVYIDQGLLDARNLDLPRRVRFKKRRTHNKSGNENIQHYRIKRTYRDFEKYTEAFPDLEIVELDTVKGTRDAGKCLMTLLFRRSDFMLIFYLAIPGHHR